MWCIGFNKPGALPDFIPYQRDTFEDARLVLTDILDEAASCARDAGEKREAALLENAKKRLARAKLRLPKEIGFDVGGYRYWIACLQ